MSRKTSTLLSIGLSAILIAAAIWMLFRHDTGLWPMNRSWGVGYHHMIGGGMGIVMLLFWIVIIGACILLITGTVSGIRGVQHRDSGSQTPLEILKRRYAMGEIDKAEYEEKRRILSN